MFYNTKQAAEYLRISESYLEKERAAGRFPEAARAKWYTQTQLDDFVSQCETFGEWSLDRWIEVAEQRRAAFVSAS